MVYKFGAPRNLAGRRNFDVNRQVIQSGRVEYLYVNNLRVDNLEVTDE